MAVAGSAVNPINLNAMPPVVVTVHIFMRTWAATGRRPREGARFNITMKAAAQYVHQQLLPAVNHHGYRPAGANMDEAGFAPNEDLLNMA
jgi:hypothetical protein